MKRVKRSYCEVPFVVTVDGRRVTGKIDRLCELSDGSWVVIDYKSEASLDYAALVDEYALSLSVYVEATGQIVRAEIAGWLYFTETGVLLEC
jgi:ATP-dependent exoDNAse (exonuclease V) beta subunit